jgi:hypothetical protein
VTQEWQLDGGFVQSNTPSTRMKKPISILLFSLASLATLPAAITITVVNNVPNGTASGAPSGTGVGTGLLTTSFGSISSNRGLPATNYTVSGVDLTSLGGSATESFTFTVGYTATTNGTTPSTVNFSSPFGNVAVGGNNFIDGAETLTATITLTSSTFAGLSLTGFTKARAGGFPSPTGESGTFTWEGGSANVVAANTIVNITGNSVTFNSINSTVASTLNFEGFEAQFSAVPEPASTSLLALGALALLHRRRTA